MTAILLTYDGSLWRGYILHGILLVFVGHECWPKICLGLQFSLCLRCSVCTVPVWRWRLGLTLSYALICADDPLTILFYIARIQMIRECRRRWSLHSVTPFTSSLRMMICVYSKCVTQHSDLLSAWLRVYYYKYCVLSCQVYEFRHNLCSACELLWLEVVDMLSANWYMSLTLDSIVQSRSADLSIIKVMARQLLWTYSLTLNS